MSHETIHAQQGHSFDLILAEIVHIVLWFNPVLIYYKRSLRQIHEYLADDQTDTTDRQQYAQKLFGYVFQVEAIPLTNSFLDSLTLKNRIKMLYQKRSSRWVLGRYLLALPLLGLLITLVAARVAEPIENVSERITVRGQVITQGGVGLPGVTVVVKNGTSGSSTDVRGNFIINVEKGQTLVFSFVGYKSEERGISNEKMIVTLEREPKVLSEIVVVGNSDVPPPMQPNALTQNKGDEVFTVVEQQPEFEGGSNELNKFIGQNMKYPATAARANVEGKVFIQFDISETGETSNIEILKGIGFGCDEEAVRVMSIMPKWKPGRQSGKPVAVRFYLPVSFMLEKAHERKTTIKATPVAQPLWKGDISTKIDSMLIDPNERSNIKKNIFSQKNLSLFGDERPLYVVDGKVIKKDKDFEKLNPIDIMTMSVLKSEEATQIYGEKGKNGVIVIESKKAKKYVSSQLNLPDTKIKPDNLDLNENVTYFIENEKITKEEMEKIKPEDIESVNVQKKDKGKNSTVIITLKKKKE